jgi:hypothetical protein
MKWLAWCAPEQLEEVKKIGVTGVLGTLNDRDLLIAQAQAADAVINAASSDNRAAVETLSTPSPARARYSCTPAAPASSATPPAAKAPTRSTTKTISRTADKAARVGIDRLVLDAANKGVRSAVLCNT